MSGWCLELLVRLIVYVFFVLCLFVIWVVSLFCLESGTVVLTAPVHGHCLLFTFEDYLIKMNKLARSSTYVYRIFIRHSRAANSCLHDVLYVGRPVNSRSETMLYSFTCNGKLVLSIGAPISCPLIMYKKQSMI